VIGHLGKCWGYCYCKDFFGSVLELKAILHGCNAQKENAFGHWITGTHTDVFANNLAIVT
jgi:hypothetical protein